MGTGPSLRPSRRMKGTDGLCGEREPALRKNFLKAGPGTPLGWGGRRAAGARVGGVSAVAERPQISLHSAAGNQRLYDGRKHNEERKVAGLEPEIVWETEAGHPEEGGEAFQEALHHGRPPGFSPLQPQAPGSLWNPELGQCSVLLCQRSPARGPGRVHEMVTAAMLSGISDLPTPSPWFCLWTDPRRPRPLSCKLDLP